MTDIILINKHLQKIESILIKAFNEGRLQRQPPAKFIDYTELSATWKDKVQKAKDKQAEN